MPSVLGCSPSGSRYGNVPNELIHRAGPPFLDNHYRSFGTLPYLDPEGEQSKTDGKTNNGSQTMVGTLVMAPKSVTF